jgi:hypothetical protein
MPTSKLKASTTKTNTTKASTTKTSTTKAQKAKIAIQAEIQRLVSQYGYDAAVLTQFSAFVLNPPPPPKPLTLTQLKQAIFQEFKVVDAKALKKSSRFKMATSAMENFNLSQRDGLEMLYRKLIGILPNEVGETGPGCVNGINIFKYDRPWEAFGLDPKTATTEQVKTAYYDLSRIYHPDNRETGDAVIFNRLNVFYKSLTEKF